MLVDDATVGLALMFIYIKFVPKDVVKCNATHMQTSITRVCKHFYQKNALRLLNWVWLLSKHPISQQNQLTKKLSMQ